MITRVWGVINSVEVEFERVPDRPDFWQGIGPRVDGLQQIEVWAENSSGAKAYLPFAVSIKTYGPDLVTLLLSPYRAYLLDGPYNSQRGWLQDGSGKHIIDARRETPIGDTS